MSESFKLCPICDTPNHRNALVCTVCGTSLTEVKPSGRQATGGAGSGAGSDKPAYSPYDYRYGETDLYEGNLRQVARRYLAGLLLILILGMAGGAVLMLSPRIAELTGGQATRSAAALVTNTPRPTLTFKTVTQGSPTLTASPTPSPSETPSLTPTREPCLQSVLPEDGLISVVSRCGHRDLFVITEVIEINNLLDVNDIRPGDVIEVPWPTDTPDPNVTPSATPEVTEVALLVPTAQGTAGSTITGTPPTVDPRQETQAAFNLTLLADPFFVPTPTLPPGVMYHVVQPDDNAIIISDVYNTSVEVLSQLNPEITFSQCDFGVRYGGPRCIIPLGQGQLVRVPAPTPTKTLSPTPSGSETATPTPTATYNAPVSLSPSNHAYFRRDQFVTLRWLSTGTLGATELYLVDVQRIDDDEHFSATTSDTFYRLPPAWQGVTANRYEYRWTISVVNADQLSRLRYTTGPLSFTWEGTGAVTATPTLTGADQP